MSDLLIRPGPETQALIDHVARTNAQREGDGHDPLTVIAISTERATRLAAELYRLPCYAIAREHGMNEGDILAMIQAGGARCAGLPIKVRNA